MATSKEKKKPVVSPKGIAVWPKLTQPDTKFKAEGEYSIKLKVHETDADNLIAIINEKQAEAVQMGRDEKGKNAKIKEVDLPYAEELDADGNPTGFYIFKFTMKAKVSPKKGEPFTQRPALYDAQGKALNPASVKIGGGSIVKVAFFPQPYYTALGAGVSMRLQAVQVLSLVEFGERAASAYGFGAEDGYSAASALAGDDEAPESTDDDF